jgi:hypothetical protein
MSVSIEKAAGMASGVGSGCAIAAGSTTLGLAWVLYKISGWLIDPSGRDNIGLGAFLGQLFALASIAALGLGALIFVVGVGLAVFGAAAMNSERKPDLPDE